MAPANPGAVRAKFICVDVMTPTTAPGKTVTLLAVTAGDANASWAAATPAGVVQLGLMTEAASSYFEKEKEYFIDVTRADLPAAVAPAPSDARPTSANDKVLALVPDATPEQVAAAIYAFDAIAADGGDVDQQKGAAVVAAMHAGATDVQAHAIAAAIPVLVTNEVRDPAPLDRAVADPAPGA